MAGDHLRKINRYLNVASFLIMLQPLLEELKANRQRKLVRLIGERLVLTEWLDNELNEVINKPVIWFGRHQEQERIGEHNQYFDARLKQYQQYLGQESDIVVFDCYAGLNPDALGALTGTIKQGGVCLLLTPPDEHWLALPDPELQRICAHPYQITDAHNLYISRFIKQLQASNTVTQYSTDHNKQLVPVNLDSVYTSLTSNHNTGSSNTIFTQQNAVKHIVDFGQSSNASDKQCIVLQADRGRGKTAALGLAAAKLLQIHYEQDSSFNIVVCAPVSNAIETLFKHAQQQLEGQRITFKYPTANDLQIRTESGKLLTISFFAPDALSLTLPKADLVMIDEAAAIPIQVLKPVINHYQRQIYSTTIMGYEGTGRGFEYKLKPLLQHVCSSYQTMELTQPIRWQADDHLERDINRLLAVDLTIPSINNSDIKSLQATTSFTVHTHKLTDNNFEAYEQAFALLKNAHYRTTPNDLRYMLDAPNVQLMSLSNDDTMIATALVVSEGSLEPELCQQIWQGRRRPRGNLFPQSLIAHAGFKDAGNYKYARVVRIAVNPNIQGHQFGTDLLSHIKSYLTQQGYDFICTSFGYWHKLYNFWFKNGFNAVRLGIKAEASSGEYSIFMCQPLTEQAVLFNKQLQQRFQQTLQIELKHKLIAASQFTHDHQQGHLSGMSTLAVRDNGPNTVTEHDLSDLDAFANHHRTFDSCLLAMTRFTTQNKASLKHLTEPQQQLLCDSLTPTMNKKQLIVKHQFTGEKQLIQSLRLLWQTLITLN
ncbi:MAG: tRNA(Met) cytidine acetyltransferase [Gammaproteobacteria bacterium]|nr:tRNA(Met) cytidine acetyltransferase [Gammaproteobacteria bacterium]